ncbi:hypothetical protein [Agrobacterium sp.]|uniref:hypothetical protein n=1 Tax=Agrobacterium sp. TaxID=361 RepID=UPI0028AFF434|nr:hypothetical protein [Agrobacterium sp.]
MTPEEISTLAAAGNLPQIEGVDPATAQDLDGYLCVSDLVAIAVEVVSPMWNRAEDCELKTSGGQSFGTLCFTKDLGRVDRDELTQWRYAAYLADSEVTDVTEATYAFKRDYIVIDASFLVSYLSEYRDGAPIWGGFSHESYNPSYWSRSGPEIIAKKNISPPTEVHAVNFARLTAAGNNFERYLRMYHCVELLFDYVIFKKIKRLNDDLFGYAEVMKENSRVELDRLKILIREYCKDVDKLADALHGAAAFEVTCREIFQTFSKDGNPLGDEARWSKVWPFILGQNLSLTNMRTARIANDADVYGKFVIDLAAYWIYRVRCSIAHNRVGEFIITDDHDEFVGKFACSLLGTVLEQLLADEDFRSLNA